MTRLLFAILLAVLLFPNGLHAQTINNDSVSKIISQKMKDSLNLSDETASRIYRINMRLAAEKREVREKENQTIRLTNGFQRIENQRDSLYQEVLSREEFERYEKMKAILISVNKMQ